MSHGDELVGALLLQRRVVSADKLNWALLQAARSKALGSELGLAEVLTRNGVLTPHQLSQLLSEAAEVRPDPVHLEWTREAILQAAARVAAGTGSGFNLPPIVPLRPSLPSAGSHGMPSSGLNAVVAEPKRWGRYEVGDELGRGAMGVVFRAVDVEADRREVAIKVLLQGDRARPDILERFRREARTLERLKHPAIVRVFDHGVFQKRAFIAMEYVAGTPLKSVIADLPLSRGLVIMEEIADALAYAHEQDVVHRDLKPENVLIAADGKPRIMDFGLAKILDESSALTRNGDLVGTPIYMSPEQIRGELDALGPSADLWALGCTFYEFLTGGRPFNGETVDVVSKLIQDYDPPAAIELRPDCPAELSAMCQTMLNKDRCRRYPSARAVAEDIRRYLRGQEVLLGQGPKEEVVEEFVKAGFKAPPWLLALGVALAVVLLGGLGVELNRRRVLEGERRQLVVSLEGALAQAEEVLGVGEELLRGAPEGPAPESIAAAREALAVFPPTRLQVLAETEYAAWIGKHRSARLELQALSVLGRHLGLWPPVPRRDKRDEPAVTRLASQARAMKPGRLRALLSWAEARIRADSPSPERSLELYRIVLERYGTSLRPQLELIALLRRLGRAQDANTASRIAFGKLRAPAARHALLIERASAFFEAEADDQARAALRRAAELAAPLSVKERLGFFVALSEMGAWSLLAERLEELSGELRNAPEIAVLRAQVQIQRRRFARALALAGGADGQNLSSAWEARRQLALAEAKSARLDKGALICALGAQSAARAGEEFLIEARAALLRVRLLLFIGKPKQAQVVARELKERWSEAALSGRLRSVAADLVAGCFAALADAELARFLVGEFLPDWSRLLKHYEAAARIAAKPSPILRRIAALALYPTVTEEVRSAARSARRQIKDESPVSLSVRGAFELTEAVSPDGASAARSLLRQARHLRRPQPLAELQSELAFSLEQPGIFDRVRWKPETGELKRLLVWALLLEPLDVRSLELQAELAALDGQPGELKRARERVLLLDSSNPGFFDRILHASRPSAEDRLKLLVDIRRLDGEEQRPDWKRAANLGELAAAYAGLSQAEPARRIAQEALERNRLQHDALQVLAGSELAPKALRKQASQSYKFVTQEGRLRAMGAIFQFLSAKPTSALRQQTRSLIGQLDVPETWLMEALDAVLTLDVEPGNESAWRRLIGFSFEAESALYGLLHGLDLGSPALHETLREKAAAALKLAATGADRDLVELELAFHGLWSILAGRGTVALGLETEALLTQLLERRPRSMAPRLLRAVLRLKTGAPGDALEELKVLRRRKSGTLRSVLLGLGAVCLESGDPDVAKELAQRAMRARLPRAFFRRLFDGHRKLFQ